MSDKLNINQWAAEDRPREKMERLGSQALSDAELLAILIGSGSPQEDAVSLMKRILNNCNNNLNTLGKMSIHDLCQYNGVGPAKAITIMAACELGKRRQQTEPEERPCLSTATRIYNHMHPVMQDMDTEEFWVLLMNQDQRLIKKLCIAHGGISEVSVDIRIIIREAVLCNATIQTQSAGQPADPEPVECLPRHVPQVHGSRHCCRRPLLQLSRRGRAIDKNLKEKYKGRRMIILSDPVILLFVNKKDIGKVQAALGAGGVAFGAFGGAIIGAANSQADQLVCYVISSGKSNKGVINVRMLNDEMMDLLLTDHEDVKNEFYSEKSKRKRLLVSYVLPILEKRVFYNY